MEELLHGFPARCRRRRPRRHRPPLRRRSRLDPLSSSSPSPHHQPKLNHFFPSSNAAAGEPTSQKCNVNLAHCVAYLAMAPKSVAVCKALAAAEKVVNESGGGNEGVPLHLRNAPTKMMTEMGYGKGYAYTPDDPSALQTILPPSLQGYKCHDWPTTSSK